MNDFSLTQLRARLSLGLWALVALVFAGAFFAGGGSGDFHVARIRHLVTAVAIAVGYAGHFAIIHFTGKRKGGAGAVDERDVHVLARAGQATLIIYLTAQYALSIGLFAVFESSGEVPVGWLYLLACAAPIVGSLVYSISTVVIDRWARAAE